MSPAKIPKASELNGYVVWSYLRLLGDRIVKLVPVQYACKHFLFTDSCHAIYVFGKLTLRSLS